MTPRATVRLQFHSGFTFDDAAATVDYHAALGISHFYASPIFTARPGSTHGYDVTDPTQVNPELGGEAGLRRLVERLRAADMGLVIDIVPNHMGVATADNRYWQDVLAWGEKSPYAAWFDIDWQSPVEGLRGKVMLPTLGAVYDEVLASGDLKPVWDADSGRLLLAYHDARFPLSAASIAALIGDVPVFAEAAAALREASPDHVEAAHPLLAEAAATGEGRAAMDRVLAPFEAGDHVALHTLLQAQHYQLSWWRNAAEQINWRRFFEVSELAGVRVEQADVFDATHALTLDLYAQGLIDGVRVDHVDGLADPAAYCQRLRQQLSERQTERPGALADAPAWLVIEKILSPDEAVPAAWGVDGTTGYDFMDQVGAVLHKGDGEAILRKTWTELTGDDVPFDTQVQRAREQLLSENFGGEFDALARALHRHAAEQSPYRNDVSLPAIRRVLFAFLAAFRRYRTYSSPSDAGAGSAADQQALQQAFDGALAALHLPDHALLLRVAQWLGLASEESKGPRAAEALRRFQQLTPPLAAKSIEDTVFYRQAPLLSRNDVGSWPADVSPGVEAFHAANAQRATDFPRALLATATHDHKRGEDTRARLAVLSELADEWSASTRGWMADHAELRATVPGHGAEGKTLMAAPSPADELMLYQALLGAWPAGLIAGDTAGLAAFEERVAAWQEKAAREAKNVSSWMLPNADYEAASRAFLHDLLCGRAAEKFVPQMAAWAQRLTPATSANALTQTLLRLTSPGVPDLYQGSDFADFSLVDPDNRKPVDMEARRAALASEAAIPWTGDVLLQGKQRVIQRVLALRQSEPLLFCGGEYLPLEVHGAKASHVIAFARRHEDKLAITVTLRHPAALLGDGHTLDWSDTTLAVPGAGDARWNDVLSGNAWASNAERLALADVLGVSPVALLVAV